MKKNNIRFNPHDMTVTVDWDFFSDLVRLAHSPDKSRVEDAPDITDEQDVVPHPTSCWCRTCRPHKPTFNGGGE